MDSPISGCLAKLPGEVLDLTFDCLPRPSDLKALCLVSKQVSGPALRRLYRYIVLPWKFEDRSWTRVDVLVRSQHLRHVQSINIASTATSWTPEFCGNLHHLLHNLTPNTLKRFNYGFHGRMRPEDLMALWQSQKVLRSLQLDFSISAPLSRELINDHRKDLQSLTCVEELYINFGMEEGEALALDMLDYLHFDKLRSISMHYAGMEMGMRRPLHFKISPYRPMIVSTHFPRTLTHISLAFVNLPSPDEWRLSDYHELLSLELVECVNVAAILDSGQHPKLKHFGIQRRAKDVGVQFEAAKRFLQRFGSLESLSIATDYVALPSEFLGSAIGEHDLLRSLCVEGYEEEDSLCELYRSLKWCPNIECLALPFRVGTTADMCESLLPQLPKLEVLICHADEMTDTEFKDWKSAPRRKLTPQLFAEEIFQEKRKHKGAELRLIIFEKWSRLSVGDVSDGSTYVLAQPSWLCYIQAEDQEVYGGNCTITRPLKDGETYLPSFAAVELDRGLAKYMFPGARNL